MLSKAKHLFTFGFISILFLSCKNEIKQDVTSAETIVNTDSSVNNQITAKYPTWILEFQRLRQALYQNDISTIATFFDFPLTTEQVDGLSSAILFNTNKEINIISIKDTIEYKKYNHQIFSMDFVKSMLPIKSDSLLANNFASSAEWKKTNKDILFNSSVSYDNIDKSVSIMLNVKYLIEKNTEYETTTESSLGFIFKLNKNNQLKFDKVVMAG